MTAGSCGCTPKQQVAALGLIAHPAGRRRDPPRPNGGSAQAALSLDDPDEELFAVGNVQLAALESELVAVVINSLEDDEEAIRFIVAPEQLQAMAEVALEIVAAGRPICPHCHLPEDPDGHRCPATNGHFAD